MMRPFTPSSIRVLLGSIITLGLILSFNACASKPSALEKLSPAQTQTLLPDTLGKHKPVVLSFHAPFCLTCQALAPKIEQAVKASPGLTLKRISLDSSLKVDKALVKEFKVYVAPVVLFIRADGTIVETIKDDVEQDVLNRAAAQALKLAD